MPIRLGRQEGVPVNTDGLGPLQLFWLSAANEEDRARETRALGPARTPEDVVRILARYACHRPEELIDGKFKPKEATLSREDVERLSDADIESIANTYIAENESLNRESVIEVVEEDGRQISRHRYGEVKCDRLPNESLAAYLVRLLELRDQEMRKLANEALGPMSSFSGAVQSTIASTFAAGEALRGSMLTAPRIWAPRSNEAGRPVTIKFPVPPEVTTNRLLEEIGTQIGDLVEHSGRAAEYAVQANNTQISIANAIRDGIAGNQRSSTATIVLSVLVLVLSAVSLVVTSCSVRQTASLAAQQAESHQRDLELVERYLARIAELESQQLDTLAKIAHPDSVGLVRAPGRQQAPDENGNDTSSANKANRRR